MTLLEQLAQQRTHAVIDNALSVTIERVAAELSRELLDDAVFREELKAAARESFSRAVRALRTPEPRPSRAARRTRKGGGV